MQTLVKFPHFVPKILSGNQIFIITKGNNYVVYLQKLTRNHPNLDLVNVNTYAKFGLILSMRSQHIERKPNSDDVDLVNTNAYAKYDQSPPICSQDIERKRNFDSKHGPKLHCKFVKIDA